MLRILEIRSSVYLWSAAIVLALMQGTGCVAGQSTEPRSTDSHSSWAPKGKLDNKVWRDRHEKILQAIKADSNVDLILVGDSITENYEKSSSPDEDFQPTWVRFYGHRKALNLGVSGDTTANVLWRLDHGEVDSIKPKVAVVLVGTNDTATGAGASDVENGIESILSDIEQRLPEMHILLLGILPSDLSGKKSAADQEVNEYFSKRCALDRRITFLDIGAVFYQDGRLNTKLFYDPRLSKPHGALHPDTRGQRMMAEAIEPTLTRLMGDSARQYLSSLEDVNSAVIPVPRLEQDSYDWYARHAQVLELKKHINPQVVLIGDSITHFWAGSPAATTVNGPKAWAEVFGGLSVLNLGFGWDRTQNVLWRLGHGELTGLHPATIILNIGTNNLAATENSRSNSPDEIVAGILAIHSSIRAQCPESKIIVMGIFPRMLSPLHPFRAPIRQVNWQLSRALAGAPNTVFLDISDRFLMPDGTLPSTMMKGGTHPTDAGYHVWAQALIENGIR